MSTNNDESHKSDEPKFCVYCGARFPEDSKMKYCFKCGQLLPIRFRPGHEYSSLKGHGNSVDGIPRKKVAYCIYCGVWLNYPSIMNGFCWYCKKPLSFLNI
ncbi:MAG: hypothetical protein ACTSXP_16140 [Promethearchaeota archaeon]